MNLISKAITEDHKKARDQYDYLEELRANYDPSKDDLMDRRRDLERDSFDALTDGQYGSFDNFNGDYDNLRDSMGF